MVSPRQGGRGHERGPDWRAFGITLGVTVAAHAVIWTLLFVAVLGGVGSVASYVASASLSARPTTAEERPPVPLGRAEPDDHQREPDRLHLDRTLT